MFGDRTVPSSMITKSLMMTNSPYHDRSIRNISSVSFAHLECGKEGTELGAYDYAIVFDLGTRADLSSFDDAVLTDRDKVSHLHRVVVEGPVQTATISAKKRCTWQQNSPLVNLSWRPQNSAFTNAEIPPGHHRRS